ncbi:MAG: hypothetical protein KAU90_09705, partial [Sulfurovaceae bacterium]|nr:hypothetical protein [Sulfurovaceae bacterium]
GKLRRVRIDKEPYSGLNSQIYDTVYQESFCTFLDMFSRNPSQYAITHQEAINLYNYFFDYFSKILHKHKIELLLFHMFPHFGSDYLLTVIAKHMNIKMVLMYQSLVPNRFQYVTDLNDFGKFETSVVKFEYPYQEVKFGTKKVQFYMKNIKLKYKSCNYTFLQKLRRYIFRSVGRMTFLGMIKSYLDCLKFKYYYHKLKHNDIDTTKKSVYFPLQMQPEMTTSTLGGIYSDQLLAIEKISNIIPDDWIIHVKENPKQLEGHRGEAFFKRLSLIKKVRYISKEVNSFDLIDACEFVANVSGTVGWEALMANRVCIVFGKAWYQGFNGIIKYHNDLTLQEIIDTKIDKNQVEKDYNNFIEYTANGIVDRGYIDNFPEYSDENNAKYLKESLSKIIEMIK